MRDPRFAFVGDVLEHVSTDLAARLGGTAIRITIGAETIRSFCGQVLAYQTATLLARLFDRVEVLGDEACPVHKDIPILDGSFLTALRTHLPTLRPIMPPSQHGRVITAWIGDDVDGRFTIPTPDIFIGAAEWVALISVTVPQPVQHGRNPVGALAAGALAAGEIFKFVFEEGLTGAVRASEIRLSLLTYQQVELTDLSSQPRLNDMQIDALLVGCGSVGCAFLSGLLLTPDATGTITIVDNGSFDGGNPYKYSLLDFATAQKKLGKASWGRDKVNNQSSGKVKARAFEGTAYEYLATLPENYRIPIAVSAVDTSEARLEIQDMLPRAVINAGVSGTTTEVSSHGFGDGACLSCLIMQKSMESWNAQPLAIMTGLSVERVRTLIVTNAPLTEDDMFVMIGAAVLSRESVSELPDYLGQPLLSFLNRVLYAEARLIRTDGNPGARVTTAFVSAFAGTMLYAEFLKATIPQLAPYKVNNSYRQDLLGIPSDGLYRYPRDPDGACVCFSPFRQRVYGEKYGVNQEAWT